MSVDIPADILPFVESLLATGQFKNEADVVAAALRNYQQDVERLRGEILPALARCEAGAGVVIAEQRLAFMKEELRERIKQQVAAEKRSHG